MKKRSVQSVIPEVEMMKRLSKGDEEAFTQLFYTYSDKLFGFLYNLLRSRTIAEDIVQNVFLKIWQKRTEFSDVENIPGLLFKIAQNEAVDVMRKQSRETLGIECQAVEETKSEKNEIMDGILETELNTILSEAVDQLPLQQKRVYQLHKEQGIKHADIAQQLNLSVSTIQSHMKLAVGNIQKYISFKYSELLILIIVLSL
ncbi:MAG TPA: RNA polymerase sigma-70 factor [Paludibacter sp.]|nr:RNA polymerase sigma-70 factor [Paludibacter sp.]